MAEKYCYHQVMRFIDVHRAIHMGLIAFQLTRRSDDKMDGSLEKSFALGKVFCVEL